MPRVSEAHKDAVRGRLVDAAIELLRERGVAQTTTRGILERADLSAGALYHYFSSKAELFAAVAERIYHQNLESLLAPAEGPLDQVGLINMLESLLRQDNNGSLLPDLRPLAVADPDVADALRAFDRQLIAAMTGVIEDAKRAGAVAAETDSEALVEMVLIFFEGLRARHGGTGFVTNHERVAASFVELVRSSGVLERDGSNDAG